MKLIFSIILFLVLICPVIAFEQSQFDFAYTTPTNYSLIPTVNSSDYWNTNEGTLNNVADIILSWITPSSLDISGYTLTTSFLNGIVGTIDMRGDPWYLSGTDFQIAESLIVDKNISASNYFVGNDLLNSSHIPDHNGHTIKTAFEHIINRGKAETITISLTGGLDVSWTAGEIYDSATNTFQYTDAGSGTLTSDAVNYLKWTGTSTLGLATSSSSGDEILIATFSNWNGIINSYREHSLMDESIADTRRGLRIAFPNRIISGMSVSEDADATNDLDVSMDAGQLIKDGIEEKNPSAVNSRTIPLTRLFHSGGDWTNDTDAEINTTAYDDGNNLVNIPNVKYVKAYFIFMNGKIGWIYPTTYYNTKAQAEASALSPMPPGLEPIPKLTAIVYQQGDTDFTGTTWQDIRPGISEESFNIVSDHGSLAGLEDDDHPHYWETDGSDVATGAWFLNNYSLNNISSIFSGDGLWNITNTGIIQGDGSELTGISTYNSTYDSIVNWTDGAGATNNLSTTNYGFFGWLGSLTKRIKTLFVQDINFNGAITGTGDFVTTANIKSRALEIESSDEATQLLTLDQDYSPSPFIDYQGASSATVGSGTISTGDGGGAISAPHYHDFTDYAKGWDFVGMVKVEINGVSYWMPYYADVESEPE